MVSQSLVFLLYSIFFPEFRMPLLSSYLFTPNQISICTQSILINIERKSLSELEISVDSIGIDYNASHLYFDRLLSRHIVVLFRDCVCVYGFNRLSAILVNWYIIQLLAYNMLYLFTAPLCQFHILTHNTKRVQCKFLNQLQHCISSDPCGIINFTNASNPVHCAVCCTIVWLAMT